jgi:hypothetical protein
MRDICTGVLTDSSLLLIRVILDYCYDVEVMFRVRHKKRWHSNDLQLRHITSFTFADTSQHCHHLSSPRVMLVGQHDKLQKVALLICFQLVGLNTTTTTTITTSTTTTLTPTTTAAAAAATQTGI